MLVSTRSVTAQKMKFSIEDFFSKFPADLVTLTEEILNGKRLSLTVFILKFLTNFVSMFIKMFCNTQQNTEGLAMTSENS